MINWRKPIETVGGRKARLVEANIETGRIIVYTYSGSGDVFLVDEEGYRRDERASDSERQEPFIRNARVKREGWVLVEPKKNRTLNNIVAILGTLYVYPTEKEALRAILYHNMDLETKAVFFQWEE